MQTMKVIKYAILVVNPLKWDDAFESSVQSKHFQLICVCVHRYTMATVEKEMKINRQKKENKRKDE